MSYYLLCLGGGQAVGTILLVGKNFIIELLFYIFYDLFKVICLCLSNFSYHCAEEDTYGSYSKTILKYFLAEGVMHQHHLLVASASVEPKQILQVSIRDVVCVFA